MNIYKTKYIETHKTTLLKYKGNYVEIDNNMVPLIKWCWKNKINTNFCCEGEDKEDFSGRPYIVFSSLEDFNNFLKKLSKIIQYFDEKVCGKWVLFLCFGEQKNSFSIGCYISKQDFEEIIYVINMLR